MTVCNSLPVCFQAGAVVEFAGLLLYRPGKVNPVTGRWNLRCPGDDYVESDTTGFFPVCCRRLDTSQLVRARPAARRSKGSQNRPPAVGGGQPLLELLPFPGIPVELPGAVPTKKARRYHDCLLQPGGHQNRRITGVLRAARGARCHLELAAYSQTGAVPPRYRSQPCRAGHKSRLGLVH